MPAQLSKEQTMTDRQRQIAEAVREHGGIRAAGRALGLPHGYISRTMKAINKTHTAAGTEIPHGQKIVKNTIHYRDGAVIQEWVRTVPELEQLQAIVDGMCEQVKGKAELCNFKPAVENCRDTLFELDIYDPHVGMYACERETMDGDYDCDIAARRMTEAAAALLARANNPSKVVVVLGGDIMHMDNRSNTTERSNNALDVDTRYQRVVSYVVEACTTVVQMAAKVSPVVEIVITPGNHDWHSCVWLTQVLQAYYSQSDNVTICQQQSPRKYMQWGDNMLVWTHGDGIAASKWPLVIAAESPVLWGATRHRYLKMGHIHHKKTIAPVVIDEQAGLVVEYLAALCPSDSWHASAGFVGSQKGASAFEYHRKHGLQTRFYHNI